MRSINVNSGGATARISGSWSRVKNAFSNAGKSIRSFTGRRVSGHSREGMRQFFSNLGSSISKFSPLACMRNFMGRAGSFNLDRIEDHMNSEYEENYKERGSGENLSNFAQMHQKFSPSHEGAKANEGKTHAQAKFDNYVKENDIFAPMDKKYETTSAKPMAGRALPSTPTNAKSEATSAKPMGGMRPPPIPKNVDGATTRGTGAEEMIPLLSAEEEDPYTIVPESQEPNSARGPEQSPGSWDSGNVKNRILNQSPDADSLYEELGASAKKVEADVHAEPTSSRISSQEEQFDPDYDELKFKAEEVYEEPLYNELNFGNSEAAGGAPETVSEDAEPQVQVPHQEVTYAKVDLSKKLTAEQRAQRAAANKAKEEEARIEPEQDNTEEPPVPDRKYDPSEVPQDVRSGTSSD